MFHGLSSIRLLAAVGHLILLLVVYDICYSSLKTEGFSPSYNTEYRQPQTTDYNQVHLATSNIYLETIQLFVKYPVGLQKRLWLSAPRIEHYDFIVEYDHWWLTQHLRRASPTHFFGHFESNKGATFTELPTKNSLHTLITYHKRALELPSYSKHKPLYWRHSERYSSLISSILALLSGLLINSVIF